MRYLKIAIVIFALGAMTALVSPPSFAQKPSDAESQPMVRIPPILPQDATRSGSCELEFDITAEGRTKNITVIACTESLFARTSAKSLRQWKYHPADGGRTGVETKITFRLQGNDGNILLALPMPRRVDAPEVPAALKSGGKKIKSKRKQDSNFCCMAYSVGADGQVFSPAWGICPYSGNRLPATQRLAKMKFTPAFDGGEAVVSGGYHSAFWFHKGKAYTGTPEDNVICTAPAQPE